MNQISFAKMCAIIILYKMRKINMNKVMKNKDQDLYCIQRYTYKYIKL